MAPAGCTQGAIHERLVGQQKTFPRPEIFSVALSPGHLLVSVHRSRARLLGGQQVSICAGPNTSIAGAATCSHPVRTAHLNFGLVAVRAAQCCHRSTSPRGHSAFGTGAFPDESAIV